MKPLKEHYSLSLDGDVAEAIKQLAEEEDRSFSQFVNMIFYFWAFQGSCYINSGVYLLSCRLISL